MAAAVEAAVTELVPLVGTRAACAALGRARATHYRHHRIGPAPAPRPRVEPRPQDWFVSALPAERARELWSPQRLLAHAYAGAGRCRATPRAIGRPAALRRERR